MSWNLQGPFALSLSKGSTDLREVPSLRSVEGFDRLSPNGGELFPSKRKWVL